MIKSELLGLIKDNPGKTTRELRVLGHYSNGAIHKALVDLMNENRVTGSAVTTNRFEWRAV